MPTLVYLDGFEARDTLSVNQFGLTEFGLIDILTGTGWSNVAGRNGGRALQLATTGTNWLATKRCPGTDPTITVTSFYINFTSLPTSDCDVFTWDAAAGENGRLWFRTASGKLNNTFSQTVPDAGQDVGPVIATGTWYRIDAKLDVSGGTRTMDVRVDGGTNVQHTQVVAASTILAWRFGIDSPVGGTPSFTVLYDDFVASNTAADYPIGAHKVLPLHVNGDGTHASTIVSGDFDKASGADILTSTTDAWLELDDWITGASDAATTCIICLAGASTEYTEHTFADTAEATIWGVQGIVADPIISTTAHSAVFRIVDSAGTTVIDLFNGVTNTSVATHYANKFIAANPTSTTVNGYKFRFGLSTDAAPDPRCTAVMLQIAVPEGGAPAATSLIYRTGMAKGLLVR